MAAVIAVRDTAGGATEDGSPRLPTRPVPHHYADLAPSFVDPSAVQAMNLLDPDSIDAYLDGFLPSDPAAAGLLRLALGKVLRRRAANMRELRALPEDAPAWLRRRWPDDGPYHRFAPDPGLQNKVRRVADWIGAALRHRDAWLHRVDDRGRPKKLLKLGSLEQACGEADKAAMKARNPRPAGRPVRDGASEETVMALPEGFRIVRLTTPEALKAEGVDMGHCLGRAADDDDLADGSLRFFSLRDAGNRPHVTFEVDSPAHALLQCRGKGDKPPVSRYLPYVQAWIRRERYHLGEGPKATGLIEWDGAYHDMAALPRDLYCLGDLDLSGTGVAALPPGLKVNGSLDLSGTRIAALPAGLKVGGDLVLKGTAVTALPPGLVVGGDLDLSGTVVAALPAGLRVGGDLVLQGTAVTALPPGLVVGGNLDLRGTGIAALPERLKVGGHLDLQGTAVTALPERLKIGGYLDLRGSAIAALPGGLRVGGNLYLPAIVVRRLPEDAVIRGCVIGLSPAPPVADPVSGRRGR
jgi:hypothetical protein